jgi:hypothetical protein
VCSARLILPCPASCECHVVLRSIQAAAADLKEEKRCVRKVRFQTELVPIVSAEGCTSNRTIQIAAK